MSDSGVPSGSKKPHNLSEASIAYYERMSLVLSSPEDIEPTSRDSLVQNFIQQVTNDNIVTVSLHLSASRVLENFIADWSTHDNILTIIQNVDRDNILLLANHKSGSHTLQSIFNKIANFIYRETGLEVSRLVGYFGSEFAPCCIEQCIDLAFDSYGSYVLRVLVQTACGVVQEYSGERNSTGPAKKPEYRVFTPPHEFSNLPKSILNQFKASPRILEAATDTYASPALISVMEIFKLSHPEYCRRLNKKVMKSISPFHQLIDHERGSYVIQALISTANEEQYSQLFTQFQGSIYTFATFKQANYAVQTLIANIHTEEHLVDILRELSSAQFIEEILGLGNYGVVHQIVKSGLEYPNQQKCIKNLLLETFQCQHNPSLFIPLLLLMVPFGKASDNVFEDKIVFLPQDSFNLHGSLIAQTLFEFNRPKSFAKSLLASSIEGILKIASDPNGSHVLDKFVSNHNINQKYKNALYSVLEARVVDLVCCKYGSRVFDSIWRQLDQGWKERYINDLSQEESVLKSDFYGKFVLKNCYLDLYKRRKSEWLTIQTKPGLKRRMEETDPSAKRRILEPQNTPKKKKKLSITYSGDIDKLFNQLN